MKILILLVLRLSVGSIALELVEPVVELLEPVGEVVEPVVEAVETIISGSQTPIYTGVIETPANQLIRDLIGPIDENDLESTRERVLRVGNELGIIVEDNEEVVTNEDNFVYPCEDLEDLNCIREFLAESSECTPTCGPVPDINLLQATALYTSINITLTLSDFKLEGFSSAKIIGFYYNKVTGNVVLTIQATISVIIPRAFITYRRPGKESIVKSDSAAGTFEGIILTTILKKLPNLRLDTAEIHTYVPDSSISFILGPRAITSLNPEVIEGVAAFLSTIPILYRENFAFQGQLIAVYIIQKLLCDFGIVLVSA